MSKYLLLTVLSTVLFFLFISPSFCQVTGRGCNLGNSVATQFLGTAIYNSDPSQSVRIYKANSPIVPIITGNGYSGYRCGYINVYPAGSRYVSATNSTVSYNAANEITATFSTRCATATSYSSNFISGSGNEGTEVDYKYNDPAYYSDADPSYSCASQPNNLPIDDYIPFIICSTGVFGIIIIRKKRSTHI
ncbi:hypothetical protein QF042_004451 [Pedobacter sp. W3I1]|uniref:hypothetical protein n=1 Tax=Pedobacter sp. W3I1 TaxID=3042291 RepID=UPI00277F2442|nr:hypothetical protein [Pedobacter sp. W3I1]MDQ0640886.1 hypothetical protein [Pedobacter sp. W3I1]